MAWRFDQERFEQRIRDNQERREREHLAELDAMHPRHGLCYFIGCDEGLVKIGWSTDVNRRLSDLRSKSPYKLRLLATARGAEYRERHYHDKFAEHCVGGEWFERSPEIEAEIERLNAMPSDMR